jgi:hypothetical protein
VPAAQVSPIVAALDHPEVTLNPDTIPAVAFSLVDAFGEVPDPRHARGIRHGVAAILLLGACAVLTVARSFAAIGEYAHDTGPTVLDRLGVGAIVPHACTIRRVLQDLDPAAVEAASAPGRWPNSPRHPRRTVSPPGSSARCSPWMARPCAAPTS